MSKIYIVTGEIQSGKTTQLMQWSLKQKSIDGIFQPVIDGKRFIYHISSRTLKPLETNNKVEITRVGKYTFSNHTFDWAKNILNEALQKKNDWLVIDEIGPLELNGKGLEPTFSKLIESRNNLSVKIVIVVRNQIIENFLQHYQLKNKVEIIDKAQDLS